MKLVTLTTYQGKPLVFNAERFVACYKGKDDRYTAVHVAVGGDLSEEWSVAEPMEDVVRKLKEV